MPTLHGVSVSPYVRKVMVALAEKGVAYDQNPITPFTTPPGYRKMSPLGRIPCWEDGDFTLPDSSCIIGMLERSHPEPSLCPSDPKELGRALWFEEYADTWVFRESIQPVFFERVVKKLIGQETDQAAVDEALGETIPKTFKYLEGQIGDREWLVGDRFGLADLATASPFVNFVHAGEKVDAGTFPKLAAYVERVHARPSFQACIAKDREFLGGGK